MTNKLTYVQAEDSDADLTEIAAIYNHYVEHTTITFDLEPVALAEMRETIFPGPSYPAYLIKEMDQTAGFVRLASFKKKRAYSRTAEVIIYLKPEFSGRGIGREALCFIENIAVHLGMHTLISSICTENTASMKLFEANGYKQCAYYAEVGYKFDRWLDVAHYQKMISAPLLPLSKA